MSTDSSSKPGLKLLRRLLMAVAALAVLYLGTAFVLSRFLDPEALAAWLEPRLEEAFNREVEVGRAEVGFLPLGVALKDVTLADPTGLTSRLASVESIDLRVKILPLFRKELQVSRLTLESPRADLRAAADGHSNFGDLSAQGREGPAPETGSPFALNLKSIRVVDGSFRYEKAGEGPVTAEVAGLQVRASARQEAEGGWVFSGSSEGDLTFARGEDAALLEKAPLEFAFDLGADRSFDGLEIRDGDLGLGPLSLGVSGNIDHLKDPVRAVHLSMDGTGISVADLLRALPDSVRARLPGEVSGTLAMAIRVDGEAGPGQVPEVTGDVTLTEGGVVRDGVNLVEALSAEFDLRQDRSVLTSARATVLGGPVTVEGVASTDTGVDLVLNGESQLERLGSLVELPEGVAASGGLVSQLRITGPVGNIRDLRFRGTVEVSDLRANHPALGVDIGVQLGEIDLDGTRAILQDLPLSLGDDRLMVSGELPDIFALLDSEATPRFNGSVQGPRLDLRELSTRPRADSTLTYGKLAFAKVGNRPLAGRNFRDVAEEMGLLRPASLPLAGSMRLAIDTVIDRTGKMEAVNARLEYGPSFVRVTDATFNRYGGVVRTAADLTLTGDDSAPFSFSLQVQDLDAGSFLSQTTPLGRFVRGRISLSLDLIGTLDGFLLPDRPALVGSGSFTLSGGGLASAPLTQGIADFLSLENLREPSIQDWGTSFVLDDGRVRLAEATLRGAPGSPRVGGNVGLDGGLDLRSAFSIPWDRLNAAALERLGIAGEIVASVAQRPEVVQAILQIGGSVFNPAIQADPAAAAMTLGAAVRDEVTREAQERVAEQRARADSVLQAERAEAQRQINEQREALQSRATGFLRNLVSRPDTTARGTTPPATTAPDSLAPDSVVPDTVRPDTVRPDTTRPDTLAPDTIRPDTIGPDTVRPDTTRPDTLVPDTTRPDTVRPDTVRPDTTSPCLPRVAQRSWALCTSLMAGRQKSSIQFWVRKSIPSKVRLAARMASSSGK